MNKKLYFMAWLFAAFFAVGCEDLEDTYSEYAGDGMIRYVGKCSDLEIKSGWNRLLVIWKGNLDAAVDRVKITWQSEKDEKPFVKFVKPKNILEGSDLRDTIELTGLQNAVYTVSVSNLTADSTESIVESAYARPYTEEHEDLLSFGRGIVNFYCVNDKMVLTVETAKNSNVKKMLLRYTGTDGEEYTWNIKTHTGRESMLGTPNNMFRLPENKDLGIDFSKPLTVEREGILTGCIDTIRFQDVVLDLDETIWSAGFTSLLTKMYGENWESRVDEIETLELDYNLSNLQDLFYFPNLKKVILGKNRYVVDENAKENLSTTDFYSLVTLQHLKDLRGVKTERYNRHYFPDEYFGMKMSWYEALTGCYYPPIDVTFEKDLLTEMKSGNLENMPVITPLDTTGWKVTCSDTTFNGYEEHGAAWLLDGNDDTYFEPGQTLSATVIEVKIDMQKSQTLHGFKVVQPGVATRTGLNYLLSSLKIELSDNEMEWKEATYESGGCTIGNILGEITFINIPEELQRSARYIRLTMANRQTSTISGGTPLFSLRLGDFIPY